MKKTVDLLIIGQGISGTLLAFHAKKQNKSIHVIDNFHEGSSSLVAAGLINPLTGRKYVKSWMIDDLFPYAIDVYNELSEMLSVEIFKKKKIFRALYGASEENTFMAKSLEEKTAKYIDLDADSSQYDGAVKDVLSYGGVYGAQVNLSKLLSAYRQYLINHNELSEEKLDYNDLEVDDGHIIYHGIKARNILFAEGYRATENPFFQNIRHEPAKGEVLFIKIVGASFEDILKHNIFLIPMGDDIYWVGSGYQWKYEDAHPTIKEKERLIKVLDSILTVPYEVVEHKAAIRPCVKERRPRILRHEKYPNMYIFAGMGTKGSSLAPYWSAHLIDCIINNKNIDSEVSHIKE